MAAKQTVQKRAASGSVALVDLTQNALTPQYTAKAYQGTICHKLRFVINRLLGAGHHPLLHFWFPSIRRNRLIQAISDRVCPRKNPITSAP